MDKNSLQIYYEKLFQRIIEKVGKQNALQNKQVLEVNKYSKKRNQKYQETEYYQFFNEKSKIFSKQTNIKEDRASVLFQQRNQDIQQHMEKIQNNQSKIYFHMLQIDQKMELLVKENTLQKINEKMNIKEKITNIINETQKIKLFGNNLITKTQAISKQIDSEFYAFLKKYKQEKIDKDMQCK